jgi:hypothetical protein
LGLSPSNNFFWEKKNTDDGRFLVSIPILGDSHTVHQDDVRL